MTARLIRSCLATLCLLLPGGCAVHDSRVAQYAKTQLLGLKEVDLVGCLGAPDQFHQFAGTDVLTWYAMSSSSLSFSPPIVGGFSITNGGYCHITARVEGGVTTRILYSGEKNGTLAPDAYCAPIVRSCLIDLAVHPPLRGL
jgi:hypothetical protein